MSAAALATALAPRVARGLLAWARRFGKWILENLLALGADDAVGYFRGKARDMERKRVALLPIIAQTPVKSKHRRRLVRQHQWLQLRRRMWTAFARFLERNRDAITQDAVSGWCRASAKVLERIPLYGKGETCPS